jgi:hypothetical protein
MSVDKTKDNIKVTKLEEKDRKELFDKFVKGGGKVIVDSEKKKIISIDKEKQRTFILKEDEKRKQRLDKSKDLEEIRKRTLESFKKSARTASPELRLSLFSRFRINFKCWLLGVSPLTGSLVTAKFLEFLDRDVSLAISNLNVIFFELFKSNPQNGAKIIKDLDVKNPLFIELIERMAAVYNKHELIKFSELARKYPDDIIPVKLIKEEIVSLFRKLWLLHNYAENLKRGIDMAYKLHMDLDKKSASLYSRSRKRAPQDIGLVFDKLFPKLYWLFLKIKGYDVPLKGEEMILALKVSESDYVGNRKADEPLFSLPDQRAIIKGELDPEAQEKSGGEEAHDEDSEPKDQQSVSTGEEAGAESNADKEVNSEDRAEELKKAKFIEREKVNWEALPKAVKIGLKLMEKLKMDKLRKFYDPSNKYPSLELNDKAFVTFLLFREFDSEFSFILTTSKMTLKADYSGKSRIDYNKVLNDIFLITDDILEKFENYNKNFTELVRHKEIQPSPSSYIIHTKRLTELETKRGSLARDLKNLVKEMMQKTAENLEVLIRDAMGPANIVGNANDKLFFDKNIEGKKKLHQQSIFNALQYTYAYALAFVYRLSDKGGDLHGLNMELERDIFQGLRAANPPTGTTPDPKSTDQMNDKMEADNAEAGQAEISEERVIEDNQESN